MSQTDMQCNRLINGAFIDLLIQIKTVLESKSFISLIFKDIAIILVYFEELITKTRNDIGQEENFSSITSIFQIIFRLYFRFFEKLSHKKAIKK